MGSADEVNIQASELNRTMKVWNGGFVAVLHGYVCCMDDVLHWCVLRVACWFLVHGALLRAGSTSILLTMVSSMQVINRFLSKFTGMSTDEIEVETDRDNFLGPEAAIDKGVIDKVLARWNWDFCLMHFLLGSSSLKTPFEFCASCMVCYCTLLKRSPDYWHNALSLELRTTQELCFDKPWSWCHQFASECQHTAVQTAYKMQLSTSFRAVSIPKSYFMSERG